MELKPGEISALIKEQIRHYDDKVASDDIGTVIKVGDGIATVQGLDKADEDRNRELLRDVKPAELYGLCAYVSSACCWSDCKVY